MNLNQFIRALNIKMECEPIRKFVKGPVYVHRCTFKFATPREKVEVEKRIAKLWGKEIELPVGLRLKEMERRGREEILYGRERRRMTVLFSTPDRTSIRHGTDEEGSPVDKSHLYAREVLRVVAVEAALFETAREDRDVWAGILGLSTDMSDDEIERLYQNMRRQAIKLRVFLEGREAAEMRPPTIYRALLSEVDEVYSAVFPILYEAGLSTAPD